MRYYPTDNGLFVKREDGTYLNIGVTAVTDPYTRKNVSTTVHEGAVVLTEMPAGTPGLTYAEMLAKYNVSETNPIPLIAAAEPASEPVPEPEPEPEPVKKTARKGKKAEAEEDF